MNCDIYRFSTKVTGFILLTLDQTAFGTVGSFQWNSGSGQVDKDVFSPVINMKAGHADRTKKVGPGSAGMVAFWQKRQFIVIDQESTCFLNSVPHLKNGNFLGLIFTSFRSWGCYKVHHSGSLHPSNTLTRLFRSLCSWHSGGNPLNLF